MTNFSKILICLGVGGGMTNSAPASNLKNYLNKHQIMCDVNKYIHILLENVGILVTKLSIIIFTKTFLDHIHCVKYIRI